MHTPDPNGAHALPTNDVCPRCHGELAHPDELKMQLCYPCHAKEEFYLGHEHYAEHNDRP